MEPAIGCGREIVRRRGLTTLASLLAVELVALVGTRLPLALSRHHQAGPVAVIAPAPPPPPWPAEEPVAGVADLLLRVEDDAPPPAPVPVASIPDRPPPPPVRAAPPPAPTPAPAGADEPRRVLIRDDDGRVVVARVYHEADPPVVLLPDGRLGWPSGLTYTDQRFEVETAAQVEARLLDGPFAGFAARRGDHYLVIYQGSREFALDCANLLDSLYDGLLAKLRDRGFDARDAEFPLIAVIYRDQETFRARTGLPEDVLAFYQVLTNHISLYETSEKDLAAPDLAKLRRPQTVAHEGTHQILMNVGLHPRLASWPPWVVEGLAEYFAPISTTKGGDWSGANRVNPFHMATIRDLNDPLANQLQERGLIAPRIGRDPKTPLIEYLVTRTELAPTDYALAWALTHFLANKRFNDLVAYLKDLGTRTPLRRVTPEENLAEFRRYFGADLARLDRAFHKYLAGLRYSDKLPFYAVTFEQPLTRGVIRRAAMVSQSRDVVYQWVETMADPQGGPIRWLAQPYPTRTRARLAAEQWMAGR